MGIQSSSTPSSNHMSKLQVPKYDLNNLAVITVIFNPIKYASRYELYHKFDEHMTRSGVTLLTVECIFDCPDSLGLPRQKFEITREKDERHFQITAPSVLWLKENLINITVQRLPEYIEYVAWLDCDIEFERLDWPHLAIHQLQQYPIVQLFELCSFLGPSGKKQVIRQDFSFAYAFRNGLPIDPQRSSECYVHPGYAWAMHRKAFDRLGGLLDFSILGSGDIHFAFALINRIEDTIPPGMHDDYRRLACAWGRRVAELSDNGKLLGYAPVNIWHHWHGNRVNRGYFERWGILEQYQFSPLTDLEKRGGLGLIRLIDRNHLEHDALSLHRLQDFEKSIISYFRSRNEDNVKRAIPSINPKIPVTRARFQSYDGVRPSPSPTQYLTSGPPNRTIGKGWNSTFQRNNYSRDTEGDTHSISIQLQNDSFFNPSTTTYNRRNFPFDDYPIQNIYYEDGFGNEQLSAPEEISF